jgi:hypothetical protein
MNAPIKFFLALPAPPPVEPDFTRQRIKADCYIRLQNGLRFLHGINDRTFELVRTRVRRTGERVWNVIELKTMK